MFNAGAPLHSKPVRRISLNLRRMAMTPHTPIKTSHSERESTALKEIKESQL